MAIRRTFDSARDELARVRTPTQLYNGETPLYRAVKNGHESVVRLLLQKGATVYANPANQEPAIYWATVGSYEGVAKFLVEGGSSVHYLTKYGETLLHLAAAHDNHCLTQMFLDKGFRVDAKTAQGDTPLHYAVQTHHESVVELCLHNDLITRAVVNAQNDCGETASHLSTDDLIGTMMRLLLQYEADVNAKTAQGTTSL